MNGLKTGWKRLRGHFWASLVFDALAIIAVFMLISAWQTRNLPNAEHRPPLEAIWLDDNSPASVIETGQIGVIYFFAPWCGICKRSIGNLDELVASGDIAWARVVALDYGDIGDVHEFISETGVSLPVMLGDGKTAQDWQVRGFPTYFVIDGDGNIVSRSIGYSTKLGLKSRVWWNRF